MRIDTRLVYIPVWIQTVWLQTSAIVSNLSAPDLNLGYTVHTVERLLVFFYLRKLKRNYCLHMFIMFLIISYFKVNDWHFISLTKEFIVLLTECTYGNSHACQNLFFHLIYRHIKKNTIIVLMFTSE